MRYTLKRMGALACVLAFLVPAAGAVLGASPRNPGQDVNIAQEGIEFLVGGNPAVEATQGTPVTIKLTVGNAGGTDTSDQINITVTYGSAVVIHISGPLGRSVPADGTIDYECTWDTTNVPIGDQTVTVEVEDLLLPDDNDQNNIATKDFRIKPVPKPHVYLVSVNIAPNALVGDRVVVTAVVKNDGTKSQDEPDSVKFFKGTTPLVNGMISYSVPLPANNDATAQAIYYWDTAAEPAGRYVIMAQVVSSGDKLDSSPINLTMPAPNIYVSTVILDKQTILQGDTIRCTARVRNNGTLNATDEDVWFLLDNTSSPGLNATKTVPNIPKGDTEIKVDFDWNSTDAAPGNHTFKVKVPGSSDPKAMVVSPVFFVTARTPRMNMTSFQATPSTVKSGETVLLTAVLENTGTADAYNQEVRFFLTSIESYPVAIKKTNVRAGTTAQVCATYTPEIGENNTNVAFIALFGTDTLTDTVLVTSTVPLKPDLVVQSVDVPRLMIVNQVYTAYAVIANVGRAGAPNFTVKFNLGTELPYLIKNLDLAQSQNLTVNWTFTPSIVGSNLRMKVEADATNLVGESNEFNNIHEDIRDIVVRAEPRAVIEIKDVTPSKKSLSVVKGEKATVKLTVSVQNKGEKDGMVSLVIREGVVLVLAENITIPASSNQTLIYKWNITGAKTHTCKIVLEGADVGLKTSQTISVDLTETTPGFELLAAVAALAAVGILARRRKK